MALPPGLATVTVTGYYTRPDGTPATGRITLTPEPATLTSALHDVIVEGYASGLVTGGEFELEVLATDDPTVTPTGWTYRVEKTLDGIPGETFPLSLPMAAPVVSLPDVSPTAPAEGEYVVVTGPAGPQGPQGPPGSGGGGEGAVDSVNGQTGTVVLNADDVAADPAGSAAAAQAAAVSTAAADATSKVATHEADTTSVHGIANTALLETTAGAQAKVDAAIDAEVERADTAYDPAGAAATAQAAATSAAATDATTKANAAIETASTDATAKVAAHAGATDPHGDRAAATTALGAHVSATDPHGDRAYADGKLAKTANLSDLADAATARTSLGLGTAATRSVGTGAGTVAAGDDSRITGALPSTGGTISGNLAVTGHVLGQDTPAAHGVAAWCYDPALAVNSTALTNGTLYLVRVNIAAAVTVTRLYWWVGNSGSSPVSGQNQVGLYNSAGTLLASATVDASVSSAALKTTTISGQALVAGAFYWVGLLFNASVPPTLTRASGWTGVDAAANLGLAAATFRFATNGTGRTTLPSTITPASNVGTDIAGPWVAVGA